jgi:2-haloacid dehalogenase
MVNQFQTLYYPLGFQQRLKEKYLLAILSNGSPKMLQIGLEQTGLRVHFRWVISVNAVKLYKPSPEVYRLAPKRMRLRKNQILFVSSNSFDVLGAKNFGFKVCWINRSTVPLDPLGPKPELVVKSFDGLVEAWKTNLAARPDHRRAGEPAKAFF